jgi:hypothetical protein
MIDWSGFAGVAGELSIAFGLVVIASLSRRLGSVTRTSPYYVWLYVAAFMLCISVLARLLNLGRGLDVAATLHEHLLWVFIYKGLPALGITLGVIVTWRYWSWLLAERD